MDKESLLKNVESSWDDLKAYYSSIEIENEALKKENFALQKRFDRFLQMHTVAELLSPTHMSGSLQALCRQLGIHFPDGYFFAASFFNKAFANDDKPLTPPFDDPVLEHWIEQIQTVLSREFHALVIPEGDTILAIINFALDSNLQTSYKARLIPLLQEIIQEHKKSRQSPLFVAISPLVVGAHNLYRAYDSITQMIDYKSIMEDYVNDLLFADELSKWPPDLDQETSKESFQRFSFYVGIGDFTTARIEASKIIDHQLLKHNTVQTLELSMAALKDFFAHELGVSCRKLHLSDYYDQNRIAAKILFSDTVQDFEDQIERVLEELNNAFIASNPKSSLPQRILTYVDQNFTDPEINVNAVADFFGITSTYATRVFYMAYQISILNYIHQRRLTMAKEYLGSGLTIREIAERTGYRTSSNMIRAFKRFEGITPGQYAENKKAT